jgi:esterase/lipase superfamily enzyme
MYSHFRAELSYLLAAAAVMWLAGCARVPHQTDTDNKPAERSTSRAPASVPSPPKEQPVVSAPAAAPPSLASAREPNANELTGGATPPRNIIKVFFATSRKPAGPNLTEPGEHPRYFSKDWNVTLTYGSCLVTIPNGPNELPIGEVDHKIFGILHITADPMKDVWMYQPKTYPAAVEFFAAVTNDIAQHRLQSVLIGVHGYNNTFEFAGRRLAKLVYDMHYDGTPVLYSWPAGDGPSDYDHDQDRVEENREQESFTDFLEALVFNARLVGAKHIHIVAHSMGNRLLKSAARKLAERQPGIKLFDSVVLAAPDVPVTGFAEDVWPKLQAISGRCTLYVSKYDKAIFGSATLHRDGPRLGQWMNTGIPLLLAGLETIDAAHAGWTFLDHDYYSRPPGTCDLAALLIDGLAAEKRVLRGCLRKPAPPGGDWFELVPESAPPHP